MSDVSNQYFHCYLFECETCKPINTDLKRKQQSKDHQIIVKADTGNKQLLDGFVECNCVNAGGDQMDKTKNVEILIFL